MDWQPVTGAAGYWIYIRNNSTETDFTKLPYELSNNVTTFDLGYLSGADGYTVCVSAANGSIESGTDCVQAQLQTPTLTSVSAVDDHTISLSWTAVPDAVVYSVFYRDPSVGGDYQFLTGGGTGTQATVTGPPGSAVQYEYCVVGYSLGGLASPRSNCMQPTI
jgi:hypothetical protein